MGEATLEVEGSFSAKLLAGLHTLAERLDRHTREVAEANRLAQSAAALLPIPYRTRQQDVCGATGVVVLDFGGPAQGRVWELRHVVVGGDLPSTVAGGAAYVYRVAGVAKSSIPGSLSMADAIDWTATLPNVSFYGPGDAGVIVAPERVFVVITGGTNGQDYQASIDVLDRMATPLDRTSISA